MVLEDKELLPVFEADNPVEIEAVGDKVIELLLLSVEDGVMEAVPVPLEVGLPVEVGEGVGGGVTLPDKDLLAVLLGLTPCVNEPV